MTTSTDKNSAEVFAEFKITYLTETLNLDPHAHHQAQRGLVAYKVFAKNAKDAIARLEAQTPIEHPIVEIASVVPTGDYSNQLVLPSEWGVVQPGLKLVGEH